MTLHVCAPEPVDRVVANHDCPTCAAKVPMLAIAYEWYGWSVTCLGCGEHWQDGEMCPRPFAPKWRQRSIAHALQRLHGARVEQETNQ